MSQRILKLFLISSAIVGALGSCAPPPKAIVIAEAPVKKNEKPKVQPVEKVDSIELPTIGMPDDGIRMPDMLNMPSDSEFRATNSALPKTGTEAGAVISRPPTDPPSRVKPTNPEGAAE